MLSAVKGLLAYRGFIFGSVKREFQSKYQNSLLGVAWTILNPLAMIVVYTVIFSQIMRTRLPGVDTTFAYSIHLCAGILTWTMFAEITSRSQTIFLDNASLLKKVSFPRICLPVVVIINALVNFGIIFSLFTLFLIISGNFPGLVFIAILPLLLIQIVFAIGLGTTLGVLNVFFRDVGQFYGVILQFWFWMTPIVYSSSILPDRARRLLDFNPMAALVHGYQDILVKSQWPDWYSFWFVGGLAILFCALGRHLFRKHAGDMVDEL